MGLFNKKRTDGRTYDGQGEERRGQFDTIKYNGQPGELIWKFPYENITTGAQLVVNQAQEAIFYKGGAVCDIFGPGQHTLSTNNIPLLQKLVNLPFGGKTPFTAEVWYVNRTVRRNLKFGTPVPIELDDPVYKIPIPVRSFGEFGIQVSDSTAFITQMVGTLHLFTTEEIIEQFKSLIIRKLSVCISKYIVREQVTVIKISAYLDEISDFVRQAINEEFATYGLRIVNFDVASVNFDKNDPNVRKILDSQSEAQKRILEGYNYQQERQLDIMETAAANEGGAGQMMGAGMGLGMGLSVGGTFGQQMGNIAGVMGSQPTAQPPVPPPPPAGVMYHILAAGNQQQGPFDLQTLARMAATGQLTRDTYVWAPGMPGWVKAGEDAGVQQVFATMPPPPPPVL